MSDGSRRGDDFQNSLRARSSGARRRIVFAEGTDSRVLDAVATIVTEKLAHPILIGPPEEIRGALAHRFSRASPVGVSVRDVNDSALIQATYAHIAARRIGRNDEPEALEHMARDPLMQAGSMVANGEADGAVAGAVHTTADVVRAALVTLGLAAGLETLSSAFYMVFGDGHPSGPAVLTFTDAGVVPDPNSQQLADIAYAAAVARSQVVGDDARVGFLSYSTAGSAEGPSVTRVREALRLFRRRSPDIAADGELQGDAALSAAVARRKIPGSTVAGHVNVLVFPDLDAANIAYKLVQHLGGALALGPILQGLASPFNDLSRGAVAEEIVDVACITALMAGAPAVRAGPLPM